MHENEINMTTTNGVGGCRGERERGGFNLTRKKALARKV